MFKQLIECCSCKEDCEPFVELVSKPSARLNEVNIFPVTAQDQVLLAKLENILMPPYSLAEMKNQVFSVTGGGASIETKDSWKRLLASDHEINNTLKPLIMSKKTSAKEDLLRELEALSAGPGDDKEKHKKLTFILFKGPKATGERMNAWKTLLASDEGFREKWIPILKANDAKPKEAQEEPLNSTDAKPEVTDAKPEVVDEFQPFQNARDALGAIQQSFSANNTPVPPTSLPDADAQDAQPVQPFQNSQDARDAIEQSFSAKNSPVPPMNLPVLKSRDASNASEVSLADDILPGPKSLAKPSRQCACSALPDLGIWQSSANKPSPAGTPAQRSPEAPEMKFLVATTSPKQQ